MRKLFFLLTVLCFTANAQHRVLFIGNSYTYVNNLPDLINSIYTSFGDSYEYDQSTPGGCTFKQHLTVSADKIKQGGWDYVVLQEQSQLPSFPDNQFYQDCYPYAMQLCELIREYNPDSKPVFYMTWGRRDGDSQNCQNFEPLCTYEGMDSMLNLRYTLMAHDNSTLLSPVGKVWHYIMDNYPQLELYQSDGSHPSYLGSYIAACCFYTIFEGINPQQIMWNGELDSEIADIVKNSVKTIVYDSLDSFDYTDDVLSNDSTSVADLRFKYSIYPNPAKDLLYIDLTGNNPCHSIVVYDIYGRIVKYEKDFNSKYLSIRDLSPGLYIIEISEGKDRYSFKFSIAR